MTPPDVPVVREPSSGPAPFGRRVFARLFDIAIVLVVGVPVLTLTLRDDGDGGVRFPLVVLVLWALVPAILEARRLAATGATPGKRLSGLVVQRRGSVVPPSFVRAFVRSLIAWSIPATAVLVLDGPWVAGVIVVVYGPAAIPRVGRALHDLVAGTSVSFTGDISDEG